MSPFDPEARTCYALLHAAGWRVYRPRQPDELEHRDLPYLAVRTLDGRTLTRSSLAALVEDALVAAVVHSILTLDGCVDDDGRDDAFRELDEAA